MKRHIWMALAFAGAAALAYVLFLRPGDETRIRRQIAALADVVGVDASERDPRARPFRIQQVFRRVFTRSVQVDITDLVEDSHGRDELAGMAVSADQTFGDLTLDFGDVRVDIDRPEGIARVSSRVTLTGTDHDGHPQREARDVTMRFESVGGEWRIAAITAR